MTKKRDEPRLQNIPVRTEEGRKLAEAFRKDFASDDKPMVISIDLERYEKMLADGFSHRSVEVQERPFIFCPAEERPRERCPACAAGIPFAGNTVDRIELDELPRFRLAIETDVGRACRTGSILRPGGIEPDPGVPGEDVHRRTAAELLGKPESEVTPEERRAAKAMNFRDLYGRKG